MPLTPEAEEFGRLFRDFLDRIVYDPSTADSPLLARLEQHLGADPREMPTVGATFAPFEHPDVQRAVDTYVQDEGRRAETVGLAVGGGRYHMTTADLLVHSRLPLGPVSYIELPVDVGATMACIEFGIVLVRGPGDPPHALLIRTQEMGPGPDIVVDVISPSREQASAVLDDLRARMSAHSVYRGKVFTLSSPRDPFRRNIGATFLRRPDLDHAAVVLPGGLLERIERRTSGFDAVSERLVALGSAT